MRPGKPRFAVAVICPGCDARIALASFERDGRIVVDCHLIIGGSPKTRTVRLTVTADEAHHVIAIDGCRTISCQGYRPVDVCACQLRRLAARSAGRRPWVWRPTAEDLDTVDECECGPTGPIGVPRSYASTADGPRAAPRGAIRSEQRNSSG